MGTWRQRMFGASVPGFLLLAMCAGAPAGDKKEFGLAVGQKLPFHVVDFSFGPYKRGGCPSVMISNSGTRGVVIWARTSDDKFFELAKRLRTPLGQNPKAQGHLVVFDKNEGLAEQAKKHGLERFGVGLMRGQSQEAMKSGGALADADVTVFFLDLKKIEAAWSFKSKDLDKNARDKIVGAAEKFFKPKEPAK